MADYEPTWASLDAHSVPPWYHDAKLGIFVHWGVYSVPAWAPTDADIGGENASPYAEWYPYYMYEEGSPTREYHREQYGADVEYVDFVEEWDAAAWDPDAWADLFADVGARYVVLTGEHHDGFPLWDTHYARYSAARMGPERDIVADLAAAVRDRGLRFGASYHANYNYYQPGFEGRFGHPDYAPGPVGDADAGPGPEYVDFMNAKHRELIRHVDPDLLWFDVPMADGDHLRAKELIADYYDRAAVRGEQVVVNDRAATEAVGPTIDVDDDADLTFHGDFVTPEYDAFEGIRDHKWEVCRGIGRSFGYNRAEDDADHIAPADLVRSFVDIVSKNGNLLLNVGPKADGTIPERQRTRLAALGEWLDVNGPAIFGTRPWAVAEDEASAVPVRYTWRDGDLYAVALEWPGDRLTLSVPRHADARNAGAALLTGEGTVDCEMAVGSEELRVSLPGEPAHEHAYAVRLSGVANPRAE
ncbi:MAG: alpha-L-fucosidase [Haloarculaceae archaeon]